MDALEKAKSYQPELIILDVLMPLMDGATIHTDFRPRGKQAFGVLRIGELAALIGVEYLCHGLSKGFHDNFNDEGLRPSPAKRPGKNTWL